MDLLPWPGIRVMLGSRSLRVLWIETRCAKLLFPVRVMADLASNGMVPGLWWCWGWRLQLDGFPVKLWGQCSRRWDAKCFDYCTSVYLEKRNESCSELPAVWWPLLTCFLRLICRGAATFIRFVALSVQPCSFLWLFNPWISRPQFLTAYFLMPSSLPWGSRENSLVQFDLEQPPCACGCCSSDLNLTLLSDNVSAHISKGSSASALLPIWPSTSPGTGYLYHCWFYFSSTFAFMFYGEKGKRNLVFF